jgi:hypothetical protein
VSDDRVFIATTITKERHRRLREVARLQDRSLAAILRLALEMYLARP